jgi:chromosome segregation ATPase
MVEPWKETGVGKSENFQGKTEKNKSEMQGFHTAKIKDAFKSLDQSKIVIEKSKIRQIFAARTESQHFSDGKTSSFKRVADLSINLSSKVPFLPLLSIRTNTLEELYKEIKDLKNSITDIEEKNKVSSQCIDINKVRIEELENNIERLSIKAGLRSSYEERKEDLGAKLRNIQNNWRKNTASLRKMIQDLEEELKSQRLLVDSIADRLSQTLEKSRLRINRHEASYIPETMHSSCDLLNSSRNLHEFNHTPSLSSLLQ